MKTITRTDCVRAAKHYTDGAPPAMCEKLVDVCINLGYQETRGAADSEQAWKQAKDAFPKLDSLTLRRVLREIGRD